MAIPYSKEFNRLKSGDCLWTDKTQHRTKGYHIRSSENNHLTLTQVGYQVVDPETLQIARLTRVCMSSDNLLLEFKESLECKFSNPVEGDIFWTTIPSKLVARTARTIGIEVACKRLIAVPVKDFHEAVNLYEVAITSTYWFTR